ncbi:AbfB domain-containing protein [Streptomyces sp. NPDC017936]|uniref:AbfB domain-containing protein n=1 Tax=Streptomyces sp. NPDC017936 TaxID=3365016 RepID=UPI0037A3071C
MPDDKSRPSLELPWENGWAPDTSRAPGTRRLWLAGALAVATVVACVTAIALNDRPADDPSAARQERTTSDRKASSGLISFATPSASGSPSPSAAHDGASPSSAGSSSPRPQGSSPVRGSAAPSPSAAAPTRGTSGPEPAAVRRSVRSVNLPDHYWRVGGATVRLERAGGPEFREDATFTLVDGLANGSCYSFLASDGTYLRHRDFVLRAEHDDGSPLFRQDATFCSRASSYSGAVMLEAVNYPGHFLRHRNFQLELQRYQQSGQYAADSAFRLVDGLA